MNDDADGGKRAAVLELDQLQMLAVERLQPHPQNPRLAPRQEIVEQIAAQLRARGGFDPAHAPLVRPHGDAFQIVSGHHRVLAATTAGLREVPSWVRAMSDEDAYMALGLANTQGELHPLEEGLHALHSGLSVRDYAEKVGKASTTVAHRYYAARVRQACSHMGTDFRDKWRCLTEAHTAPSWFWPTLVTEIVERNLTVEVTRGKVATLKGIADPPAWANLLGVAEAIVGGIMKPADVSLMAAAVEDARVRDEDLRQQLAENLRANRPGSLSAVRAIVARSEDLQAERDRERREAERVAQAAVEQAATARSAHREALLNAVSLERWGELEADGRADLLGEHGETGRGFDKHDGPDTEWALWSWNPVTCCRHDRNGRDNARQKRMAEADPDGFEPRLRPRALLAPRGKKPPKAAETDARHRNVLTCPMADLFDPSVPREWTEAGLREIAGAPDWQFFCRTKSPERVAAFTIPTNAWIGTTVNVQTRVAAAEAALAGVKGGKRWLAVEPMLEPLRFERLDLFAWLVIGGASATSQAPEWRPPFEWVADLVRQAREAGVRVYFKPNLLGSRLLELPFDAPLKPDPVEAPAVFRYLLHPGDGAQRPEAGAADSDATGAGRGGGSAEPAAHVDPVEDAVRCVAGADEADAG